MCPSSVLLSNASIPLLERGNIGDGNGNSPMVFSSGSSEVPDAWKQNRLLNADADMKDQHPCLLLSTLSNTQGKAFNQRDSSESVYDKKGGEWGVH